MTKVVLIIISVGFGLAMLGYILAIIADEIEYRNEVKRRRTELQQKLNELDAYIAKLEKYKKYNEKLYRNG